MNRRYFATGAVFSALFPDCVFGLENSSIKIETAMLLARGAIHKPKKKWQLRHDLCIDCRNHSNVGVIHTPGAHFGLAVRAIAFRNEMALCGIYISREAVLRSILATIGGWDNFHYHDGCGYLTLAKKSPWKLGVSENDMRFLWEQVSANSGSADVLTGRHRAVAVMIVRQDEIGENSWAFETQAQHHQMFVFQQTLVEELRLRPLAHVLAKLSSLSAVMVADDVLVALARIEAKHFDITIEEIAPTLPRFLVTIAKNGEPKVSPF